MEDKHLLKRMKRAFQLNLGYKNSAKAFTLT
jgi:hypothetical protein